MANLAGQAVHVRRHELPATFFEIDFSRPPNARERDVLRKRLTRLNAAADSIRASTDHFIELVSQRKITDDDLKFRTGYSFRAKEADSNGSDRTLPPRAQRPPVTRLVTPRGAALRLHLLALADAQLRTRPGRAPKNSRPLRPTSNGQVGWTDLLGSSAVMKGDGKVYVTAQDKRLRQLHSALDSLVEASLVTLPNRDRGAGKYEEFQLLDETATRSPSEDPVPYRVPTKSEHTFAIPGTFITEGWVHVLEDTEIALLFMTACGIKSIETTAVAIPALDRVRHYGIGRDGFEAHRLLERFGLMNVVEIARHDDGRSEDYEKEGAVLHRLQFTPEALRTNALTVVRDAIEKQLARPPLS